MILCLETATPLCSVALCDNAGIVALRESNDGKSHASLLTVFINEVLKEAGIGAADLEAVAVSKGPGSYTGLRIGVSAAKGISFASGIPLIGIDTLYSMFWGLAGGKTINKERLYCPMLDARRMEVYYAVYDPEGNVVKEIAAEVMNENSFMNFHDDKEIIFFGDGSRKIRNIFKRPNVIFDDEFRVSAAHLCIPSRKAFISRRFEDLAYFEPMYLKDFITTKQKKNILG